MPEILQYSNAVGNKFASNVLCPLHFSMLGFETGLEAGKNMVKLLGRTIRRPRIHPQHQVTFATRTSISRCQGLLKKEGLVDTGSPGHTKL